MSEYQYLHFQAIDAPLNDKQLEFMQRQSTRAEISRWEFSNEYHFGDFHGKADEMLRRGYDVHLPWLACVRDEDAKEPPVPAGLSQRTRELDALCEFYDLPSDLVAAAAQSLPAAPPPGSQWVADSILQPPRTSVRGRRKYERSAGVSEAAQLPLTLGYGSHFGLGLFEADSKGT